MLLGVKSGLFLVSESHQLLAVEFIVCKIVHSVSPVGMKRKPVCTLKFTVMDLMNIILVPH